MMTMSTMMTMMTMSTMIVLANTEIAYEITVFTGAERSAGTDANVFLQIYGVDGKTEETQLRNRTDNFETGQVDKFKVKLFLKSNSFLKENSF